MRELPTTQCQFCGLTVRGIMRVPHDGGPCPEKIRLNDAKIAQQARAAGYVRICDECGQPEGVGHLGTCSRSLMRGGAGNV